MKSMCCSSHEMQAADSGAQQIVQRATRRAADAIVILMFALHVVLVAWGAALHSPNLMEAADLPAGLSHLWYADFKLRQVNPPLVRTVAAIPVAVAGAECDWRSMSDAPGARPEFAVGRDFIEVNGARSFWLFILARLACLPFALLGAVICRRWARELYGELAGVFAAALWCFDPTILGHAQTMNSDVPAAAMGVVAVYVCWHWLKQPTWRTAIVAGITLGLSLLTRTTLIVLVPLWGVFWGVNAVRTRFQGPPFRQFVVIVVLAIYSLNLFYGFAESGRELRAFEFVSRTLGGDSAGPDSPGNRFRNSWLGKLPLPFPKSFVQGIDLQQRDFENENGQFQSYLHGRWSPRGWWYYYLYGLAVKWPVGTWALLGLSLVSWIASIARSRVWSLKGCVPLVAGMSILLVVSSQTGFSIHFRYVLPMFPFAFILMSSLGERSIGWRCAGITAVVLSAASSLLIWPHSMAYFNELAGGPRHGHFHLLSSNIDWGQDMLFLRDWVGAHPEARGMKITCSGPTPARLICLDNGSPPLLILNADGTHDPKSGPQPGWHAVSVGNLRKDRFAYFLEFDPVATAGYSIYIYHLLPEEVDRYWRSKGARSKPAAKPQ